jgi:chromosome partitioning protein
VDKQQSSRQWLAIRPPQLPPIRSWEVERDQIVRPPKGTTHVVLDTPAGMGGRRLDAVLRIADKVLVPLQPSLFDINSTHAFLGALREHRRADRLSIGVVGMRVREATLSSDRLCDWMATLAVPVVAYLRDTQNYVHLAAHGATLWDVAPSRVERDLEQWQPLVEWVLK